MNTIRNFVLSVLVALALAGCATEPFDDSALAGIWTRNVDGYQMDLRADHLFADGGFAGQWFADETTLTVVDGQLHRFEASYVLEGDELTLTQVFSAKYHRVPDGPVVESPEVRP